MSHRRWSDPTASLALDSIEPDQEPDLTPAGLVEYVLEQPEPTPYGLTRNLLVLLKYGFDINDRDIIDRALRVAEAEARAAEQHVDQLRKEARYVAWQQAGAIDSYVYYMRVGNRVKIGFTTNLKGRIEAVGPEELLAVEPGGREMEALRHAEFRHLRTSREWFRHEEPLASHITRARAAA